MWKLSLNHILNFSCKQNETDKAVPISYTKRLGSYVATDDVFRAWTSGDLTEMLNSLDIKTNLVDRHYLLLSIVDITYKNRKNSEQSKLCAQISELHLSEFEAISEALKTQMNNILPRVPTFQYYATLLSEQREYDKAIIICEQALSYGLHDGTLSGFVGRINRIRKQQQKNA